MFFTNDAEKEMFLKRHAKPEIGGLLARTDSDSGAKVQNVYLGIDSGSTTTKFVFMDEDENIVDTFYAPNEGEPLEVAKRALIKVRDSYREKGIVLNVLAVGTTGYGEMLFSKAFRTEYHVVETVAHARAAEKYVKMHLLFLISGTRI